MRKFGEIRGGVRKSGVLEHKSGNISETCVKIEVRMAYRNLPTLTSHKNVCRMVNLPYRDVLNYTYINGIFPSSNSSSCSNTVGECENADDKKEEDETAEAAPEIVL